MSALEEANKALALTPAERQLYQRHVDNLNGQGKVVHEDGSVSTIYSITIERDGKAYTIPSVYEGKIVSPAEAVKRAEKIGWEKFPSYESQEQAIQRYMQMHEYMDKDTTAYMQQQRRAPKSVLAP